MLTQARCRHWILHCFQITLQPNSIGKCTKREPCSDHCPVLCQIKISVTEVDRGGKWVFGKTEDFKEESDEYLKQIQKAHSLARWTGKKDILEKVL